MNRLIYPSCLLYLSTFVRRKSPYKREPYITIGVRPYHVLQIRGAPPRFEYTRTLLYSFTLILYGNTEEGIFDGR